MSKANKPNPNRQYFEIPHDIDERTDAQIDAWAEAVYDRFMSPTNDKVNKDEKGDDK